MDYRRLLKVLKENGMEAWAEKLKCQLTDYFSHIRHGDYQKWRQAVSALPAVRPARYCLRQNAVTIGADSDCNPSQRRLIEAQLKRLMPWRKGPFNLFGVYIDSEWRCHLKWARLSARIQALKGRLALDVGCGNGYYGWRMLGEGARHVVGIDPTLLFCMQFAAIKQYLPGAAIDILPFGIESLPESALCFDTVFSMGVIYHRRDPVAHLRQLRGFLRPGGELILETLILESGAGPALYPAGRYAGMNNARAIPGAKTLLQWAEQADFNDAGIIDITKTTPREQRRTDWMPFYSLDNFLDGTDRDKTIEGHPAPARAILLATK